MTDEFDIMKMHLEEYRAENEELKARLRELESPESCEYHERRIQEASDESANWEPAKTVTVPFTKEELEIILHWSCFPPGDDFERIKKKCVLALIEEVFE